MTHSDFFTSPARGCAPGKGSQLDIFFANARTVDEGEKPRARRLRDQARKTCREACPFTRDCFTWAYEHDEAAGIWGGVDMSSDGERKKAAAFYGLDTTAPVDVVVPESDEVLIERVLASGPAAFKHITTDQRAAVVRAGRTRGQSWSQLERRFRVSPARLQTLAGEDGDSFDAEVRRLYHAGRSDADIALTLDCDPKRVFKARKRMELPALFGPGGRLRKARREQVPA